MCTLLLSCVLSLTEFSKSLEQFQSLQSRDQYRLTNMDVYSHILFVKVSSAGPLTTLVSPSMCHVSGTAGTHI